MKKDSRAVLTRQAARDAGMTVALPRCAMRLSEFITIYLAAAAPFGVAHFLRSGTRGLDARALTRATLAALLWPVAAFVMFRKTKDEIQGAADEAAPEEERKIERTKRALANALRDAEEALGTARGAAADEAARHTFFAAREAVERYVGLTLAARGIDADAAPSEREMELCRIAGRTGDDLLDAGRCVHRRNVSRLHAHRERARTELLHALAATRETASARRHSSAMPARVSEALIQTFARAIELLSLLEDRASVLGVARLLDAECARLRELEAKPATFTSAKDTGAPVNVRATRFGVAAGDQLNA